MGNLRGRGWLGWAMLIVLGLALAVAGCSSSSSGGGKKSSTDDGTGDGDGDSVFGFSDERTDAELLEVMNQALTDCACAGITTPIPDEATAELLALQIQNETYELMALGVADSAGQSSSRFQKDGDDPVTGVGATITIDYADTCTTGGIAEVTGEYGTLTAADASTFGYLVNVDMAGCDVGNSAEVWGATRYAGEYSLKVTSGSYDYDQNITVNGGVAIYDQYYEGYYAFIVRDLLDYTGTNIDVESNEGTWEFNMGLRVDDKTNNWVCEYVASDTSEDFSGFTYDCASSASEL